MRGVTIIFIFIVLILKPLQAEQIIIKDVFKHYSIAQYCSIAVRSHSPTDIKENVVFKPFEKNSFVFGKNKETVWIKFTLKNSSGYDRNLILEITNANLYNFNIYKETDSINIRVFDGGIKKEFAKRNIDHQNNQLALIIKSNEESTYYMEVLPAYNANNFNILLWDAAQREVYKLKESQNINLFFFTNITFLLILGIVLIVTNQKWQWSLFFYVLFGVLYMYIELGLAFKNIWPASPKLQQVSSYCIANLYLIAGVLFFRGYFETKKIIEKVDKILVFLIYAGALLTILCVVFTFFFATSFSLIQSINSILFIITGVIILYVLILLLIRRMNVLETIWFIIGFTPHAIAIVLTSLRQIGLLHTDLELDILSKFPLFLWSIDFLNAMLWSMLWEVICVFVLMIYRFNTLWKENANMFFQLERQRVSSTNQLINSLEQERKRIAQELHDDSGVQLSAIRMRMTYLEEISQDANYKKNIQAIMKDLDKVSKDIRQISHNLMPITLSKLGLKAAIQELMNNLKIAYPVIIFELFQQCDEAVLPQNHKVNMYRIVQELLNNAMKYAKASEINVQIIEDEDFLILSIEDNGVGFNFKDEFDGLGLKSVRSRVHLLRGTFEVDSNVGKGSFFIVKLPLNN